MLFVPTTRGEKPCFAIPQRDPAGPWALVGPRAHWDPYHAINTRDRVAKHHCRPVACKYCGEPVRVLQRPPSVTNEERLIVVEPELVEGPNLWNYDDHGWAIRSDYGFGYRWHTKHENPNRGVAT